MRTERETELLAWLGGAGEEIEGLTEQDILTLLEPLGISGEAARMAAKGALTALQMTSKEPGSPPYRNALLYGLTRLPGLAPLLAQQEAQERGVALNLTESPPVPVAGHGTVHRGQSERGIGGSRPHIYLWFEPLGDAPCSEYFWYQYAQPTLLVDGQDETDEVRRFSYPTSGGATMKMGEWRADYIQQGVDDVDSAREASGKPKTPVFSPPGLKRSPRSTKKPKGKPYIGVSIPGHRGDGIVDAPNLCYRGPNPTARTASNISRVAQKYARSGTMLSSSRPAAGAYVISVVINFRSYLVCIDPPVSCIGYVEWTYTTTTTVQYEWRPTSSTHMGTGPRRWRRTLTARGDCTYEMAIGDFKPC